MISPPCCSGIAPTLMPSPNGTHPFPRARRRELALAVAVLVAACTEPPSVPPEGLPELYEAAIAGTVAHADAEDCVRVHQVWKAQVRAVHETARLDWRNRQEALLELAYRPFERFWQGYLGDERRFRSWVRRFDLAGDPRRTIPLEADPAELIATATAQMEEFTGRRGCSDWYVVYGPGWANLGSVGGVGMVVDFFGMPREGGLQDFRAYLPHEVSHIIDGGSEGTSSGTLLASMIGEGFASYVTDVFFGEEMSPAESLGYTEEEWKWAIDHEAEIWDLVKDRLTTRDQEEIRRFRAAGVRPLEDGPGKIGYFVGYRIVQAYVALHGADAWIELYDLDAADILERSAYGS